MEVVNETQKFLRCSTSTDASKLSESIYSSCKNDTTVKVSIRVIGAGALNQAVKAAILSNKFFSKKGLSVGLVPSFQDSENNVTVIELKVVLLKN